MRNAIQGRAKRGVTELASAKPPLPHYDARVVTEHRVRNAVALTASWLALVATATLTLFEIVNGPWNLDGGWYLFRSSLIAEGARPYLDYATIYPPLIDLIHAIPIALELDRYFIVIAVPYIWNIANAAASAALARCLGWSKAASLAAGTGFLVLSIENEGNHVTLEHGVVFFSLVALIALMKRETLSPGRLFVCGIALACAALSKQNGLVTLLPVAAILYERRRQVEPRSIPALLAGFALPPLLLLAYLDFQVMRIYRETVEMVFTYAAKSNEALPSLQWEFARSEPTGVLLPTLAAVGLVAIAAGPRRLLAATALAGAVIEFLPRLVRLYPHYTLNMWPFALLVLILATSTASPTVVRRFAKSVSFAMLAGSLLLFSISLHRWSTPGFLPKLFRPAALSLREATTPVDQVRLFSPELIVPFLAYRMTDEIPRHSQDFDLLAVEFIDRFPARQDPDTSDEPRPNPREPRLDIPAVVVDEGGTRAEQLRYCLERSGSPVIFDDWGTRNYRLTIYDRPPSSSAGRRDFTSSRAP